MGMRPIRLNIRRDHVFMDSFHQLRPRTAEEVVKKDLWYVIKCVKNIHSAGSNGLIDRADMYVL